MTATSQYISVMSKRPRTVLTMYATAGYRKCLTRNREKTAIATLNVQASQGSHREAGVSIHTGLVAIERADLLDIKLRGLGRHACSGVVWRLTSTVRKAVCKVSSVFEIRKGRRCGRVDCQERCQSSGQSSRPGDDCPRAGERKSGHGNPTVGDSIGIATFLQLGKIDPQRPNAGPPCAAARLRILESIQLGRALTPYEKRWFQTKKRPPKHPRIRASPLSCLITAMLMLTNTATSLLRR